MRLTHAKRSSEGMMKVVDFRIQDGFSHHHRADVARLFWQAFQGKLGKVLGPSAKAEKFIFDVLRNDHAISAVGKNGKLLGVAGYKTNVGSLVGGGLPDLAAHYGWMGAMWRGILLDTLERKLSKSELLMDGIFVDSKARGMGVGTALLLAIKAKSQALGKTTVRLDVIDTNPRAKSLYERQGFVAGAVQRTGLLKFLFGFNSATTMTFTNLPERDL